MSSARLRFEQRYADRFRQSALPSGYAVVLAEVRRMIGDSRRRALASVNRVLVWLYWYIGRVIVAQQEKAAWGDAVVERFSADLRAAFPDMKGLSRDNLFRMRQFYRTCCRTDAWLSGKVTPGAAKVGTPSRLSASRRDLRRIVGTPSRQLHRADHAFAMSVEELTPPGLADMVFGLSWSHHCAIIASVTRPEQHYFYMAMAVRERWSVRELRRQLDADLFTRYVSVKRDPEKCLPVKVHFSAGNVQRLVRFEINVVACRKGNRDRRQLNSTARLALYRREC